ncbi:hypothetical protein HHK36_026503 [Tetracentron sinense]|uniref:type I protein arginine methyltransferase n=1 Tax=Tetracentron sinense TaxID=13715 RepID=A0A835D4N9_TETSI|nr:hypothetical protein HHK36_026503 [Tetracentron sinense]
MEDSIEQMRKQKEFTLISISQLPYSSSYATSSSSVVARFSVDSGSGELRFHQESESSDGIHFDLRTAQLFKLGPIESICIAEGSEISKEEEKSYSRGVVIQFRMKEESVAFHCAFEHWKKEAFVQGGRLVNETVLGSKGKFEDKIEASSAKMYFHYYGQLLHQQNMLQDFVRTGSKSKLTVLPENILHCLASGTYYAAIIENCADFSGKVVVDVGAGSGILSLFAAQAGAKHVYAVEASDMVDYARRLIAGNPVLGQRITIIKGKVEEVELPEKADILISEPMGTYVFLASQSQSQWVIDSGVSAHITGESTLFSSLDKSVPSSSMALADGSSSSVEGHGTLLVNERMLESYVIARDRFLVRNGKMFPSIGRAAVGCIWRPSAMNTYLLKLQVRFDPNTLEIIVLDHPKGLKSVPYTASWIPFAATSIALKSINGIVDSLATEKNALGYLWISGTIVSRVSPLVPVVDAFDPRLLVAPAIFHIIEFNSIKEEELYEIEIPLKFTASVGTRVHGLACWFDVWFNGSTVQRWLTTAPGAPTTHWYQLRCVLSQPLYVMAGQEITGRLHMVAHNAQSYTVHLTMSAKMWGPGAVQGGILQTSSCTLDLKEPYYRMSQPQPYADQQPHQQMPSQDVGFQTEDAVEFDVTQQPLQNSGGPLNQ